MNTDERRIYIQKHVRVFGMERIQEALTLLKFIESAGITINELAEYKAGYMKDIKARLKMYYETGINKIEILIDKEHDRYAVSCSNTKSFIRASSEQEALMKYVDAKAESSRVNTGDFSQT